MKISKAAKFEFGFVSAGTLLTASLLFIAMSLTSIRVASLRSNLAAVNLLHDVDADAVPNNYLFPRHSRLLPHDDNRKNDLSPYLMGTSLVLAGDYQTAVDYFDATRSQTRAKLNNYWHGIALILTGNSEQGVKKFEEASAIIQLELLVERAVENEKMDLAVYAGKALIQLEPSAGTYYLQLARNLLMAGDVEQAERTFQTGVRMAPNYIWNRVGLGDFYLRQGDLSAAYEAYRNAWELNQVSTIARRMGLVLLRMNEYPAAEQYLRQSIEMNEGEMLAYYDLAKLMRATGRPNDAIQLLHQTVSFDPDFWPAIYRLALIYGDDIGSPDQSIYYYCLAVETASKVGETLAALPKPQPLQENPESCETIYAPGP